MMMAATGAVGARIGGNNRSQKLTRRDITDQRIMSNIMQYNSPVPSKDYSNLRLGPLKGG